MSDRRAAVVGDVMTSPVTTISAETRLKAAATLMRAGGCSALPVVDPGGRVIGVLSEADLLVKVERPALPARAPVSHGQREWLTKRTGTLACHLMTRPAVTVGPDASLADAARLMHRHGLKRLPVVDGAGRPVGIVSRRDVLQVFLHDDGEIRSDVLDHLRSQVSGQELASLTLTVEDGVVSLDVGGLDEHRARRLIESAERVDGVVAVRHHVVSERAAPRRDARPVADTSATEIEVLSDRDCERILQSHRVGRIALNDHDQPLIFPVNYAADDSAVVFRTAPGTKLSEAPMSKVAFELDEVDLASGVAWSVLVQGVAYEISDAVDQLSERLRQLVVEPMAPGEREHWMAVIRHQVSGRRFRLGRC